MLLFLIPIDGNKLFSVDSLLVREERSNGQA